MSKGPVVVASKIDTEGALLGNMIIASLEDEGFVVENRTEFGPTDVVRKAIIADEIDIYPEYTGNGGFFFSDTPSDTWKNRSAGYELVKKLDMEANKLVWLTPAPANNTWAIAVRRDVAGPSGLESLEDLADYINSGGTFKIAGSEEFVTRPDALPAFEETYGFNLTDDQMPGALGGEYRHHRAGGQPRYQRGQRKHGLRNRWTTGGPGTDGHDRFPRRTAGLRTGTDRSGVR